MTDSIMPYKLALLLLNIHPFTNKKFCNEYIGNVPKIYKIFRNYFYNEKGEEYNYCEYKDKIYKYPNSALIQMKTHNYKTDDNTKYIINNENGYIHEYYSDENVDIINIYDQGSCGNFIIGNLIIQVYPNVKTILFDCYRGYPNNIIDCNNLNIDNFIAYNCQCIDNPFEYIKKLPMLKSALFTEPDYYNQYYNKNMNFIDNFNSCLTVATNLKCVMFFECVEPEIIPNALPAPNGWSCKF